MQRIYLFLCTLILTSCKVGPNFHSPDAPKATHYNTGSVKNRTVGAKSRAGQPQHFNFKKKISASWWEIFHSKELNSFIEKGLKNNPSIEMSKANLRKAQANLLAEAGHNLFPTVDTQFLASRERNSLLATGINITPIPGTKLPFSSVNTFDLYNTSISVRYNLDLFGGTRRQLESLRAAIDYERFELEATYLTLTANIVTTGITIASLQEQIKTTKELIACQKELVKLENSNYVQGHTSKLTLLDSDNRLKETQAQLPTLKNDLAKKYNALAILIGSLPSETEFFDFTLQNIRLPTDLPVTLPSLLVKQRPDIKSSESLLHKASADIGVATANLYPQLNIGATYAWYSTALSTLFNPANNVWNYGGQIFQTLLKGGELRAKRQLAIAVYDYELARYKKVVLDSFQQVADALHALEFDAELLREQANSETNTREQFKIVRMQYQLGKANYLAVLRAKESYLKIHLKVIQAEAARYNDTAALFQSLGGGWWNNS
ncbi:outer membrane efflux protein [Legionella cherrii]|uniref:Outer membrane efflux protein n=1 Tax=Legionella cherrii TaxID=28084 RepID=A0A0W0S4T6_9GAMM|nr:efflux transporter outer membrane subunit [Legionella cherrii]KTC78503.1 outer membrane efflux protein [Legionella cherrii]